MMIPKIDLNDGVTVSDTIVSEIDGACRNTGAFYVTNHGVDSDLIAAVNKKARECFALRIDDKIAIDSRDSSPIHSAIAV